MKQLLINFISKFYLITTKRDGKFTTIHKRPKYSSECNVWSDKLFFSPKIAIVIQGPLIKDENFTLETIKLYKKIFKNSQIILSTWENENKEYIEEIKKENISIIQNKYPENKGISNINLQIISSSSGVETAKRNGAKYVLKTRTDQRIYNPNSMEYFLNLLTQFPTKNSIQQQRIVGVSLNTFKYRLYGLSDMLTFGNIKDIVLYWNTDLDSRTKTNSPKNLFKHAKERHAEIYLVTEFLKKIQIKPLWTLENSWKILAEHFCVIDRQDIDLYWHKYEKHREHKYLKYDYVRTNQEMSFLEWFNIYSNFENKKSIPENSQGLGFGDIINIKSK